MEMSVNPHLKHLLDLPARQIDIQFVQKLVDFIDVQQAVSIFVSLLEGLLHPCQAHSLRKANEV